MSFKQLGIFASGVVVAGVGLSVWTLQHSGSKTKIADEAVVPAPEPVPAAATEEQRLVDDDRPAPHRGAEQPEHDEFHDDMRVPEHAPHRDLGDGGIGDLGGGDFGWIHDLSLRRRAARQ